MSGIDSTAALPPGETSLGGVRELAASNLDPAPAVHRIPVIEESLDVRKRWVERGGYRLTKRVSTVEETVDEALRSQTAHIERRPIGTLLEGVEAPAPRHEGDTLVVPVVKEVLVTEKRLMLVEEIRIRRVDAEYRDPQHVTLRKEDILIERLDAESSE